MRVGFRKKPGIEEIDLHPGYLLELQTPDPGDDVALDVGLIGGEGGGTDGGANGEKPFTPQEVAEQHLGRFDMDSGGQSRKHLGQFLFGFLLALVSGVELLAALHPIVESAVAFGAGLEAPAVSPVTLAAGGAVLQGLGTQINHELPGGAFL
jgi:hypothetical protein